MAEAFTLSCPRCGAPAEPDQSDCRYCGTALAQMACPSCFARVFRGAEHCPRCGAELRRDVRADAEGLDCPRCREPLAAVAVGSVSLRECRGCGGSWVGAAAFERICAEREQQAAVLGALGQPADASGDAPAPPASYVPCPICRRLMNRMNFARSSGVIVDVCKGHGVWFDRDELSRIVAFVRGGGLDRARTRERETLEDARRKLRAEEAQANERAMFRGVMTSAADSADRGEDLGQAVAAAWHLLRHIL